MKNDDDLLTVQEAADYLRVHEVTLRKWARKGIGPPRTRLAGLVRYMRRDLMRWVEGGRESSVG